MAFTTKMDDRSVHYSYLPSRSYYNYTPAPGLTFTKPQASLTKYHKPKGIMKVKGPANTSSISPVRSSGDPKKELPSPLQPDIVRCEQWFRSAVDPKRRLKGWNFEPASEYESIKMSWQELLRFEKILIESRSDSR